MKDIFRLISDNLSSIMALFWVLVAIGASVAKKKAQQNKSGKRAGSSRGGALRKAVPRPEKERRRASILGMERSSRRDEWGRVTSRRASSSRGARAASASDPAAASGGGASVSKPVARTGGKKGASVAAAAEVPVKGVGPEVVAQGGSMDAARRGNGAESSLDRLRRLPPVAQGMLWSFILDEPVGSRMG